jgi:SAM-dependent methyltransferase
VEFFEQETAHDGQVMTGTLDCSNCHTSYPITDGVPRFLRDDLNGAVASTIEGFGFQWTRANVALRRAHFSSSEVFLDFIKPVRPEYLVGKTVLDGGCGLGRFTLLSAQWGARLVVGVDLSCAVDAAFENTRHLENVVIVQADLFALPFADEFDYIFSVGVLHHTADPRRAFQELARHVRAGGGFSAWVYARERNGWIVHFVNPIRRLTSRWPRTALLVLAHLVAIPLYVAVKLIYRPVAHVRWLGPLRRVLFYYDYLVFLGAFGYAEQAYIVFDHMVPELTEYIERDAFVDWFASGGLTDVVITSRSGNSWRGFGVKC